MIPKIFYAFKTHACAPIGCRLCKLIPPPLQLSFAYYALEPRLGVPSSLSTFTGNLQKPPSCRPVLSLQTAPFRPPRPTVMPPPFHSAFACRVDRCCYLLSVPSVSLLINTLLFPKRRSDSIICGFKPATAPGDLRTKWTRASPALGTLALPTIHSSPSLK